MKPAPIDMLVVAADMLVVAYITLRSRDFARRSLYNFFLAGRTRGGERHAH